MNKKFRDIADKYGITQEIGQDILARIKIENPTKNPSKAQLEGFESVCQSLKKGVELEKAIASCLAENEVSTVVKENQQEEAGTEKPEGVKMSQANRQKKTEVNGHQAIPQENPDMDSVTTEVGKQIARAMYQNVPGIAQTKFLEMKGKLETSIEKFFVADVLGGDFQKNFEEFVNADVEEFKQGKLNPQKNNSALPPGS